MMRFNNMYFALLSIHLICDARTSIGCYFITMTIFNDKSILLSVEDARNSIVKCLTTRDENS